MSFYVVLGVRRDATLEEIRRAYRRLARKYHPDINPGDRRAADLFRQISEAYETLSDPERRREYDRLGEAGAAPVDSVFEFQGFDFSVRVDEAGAPTFGELFADVIEAGAGGRSGGPEAGADLHAAITLGFEEAVRGTRRDLTVTRLERCAPCRGLGRLSGPPARCVRCDGSGQVRGVRGHMVFARTCEACAGTGMTRTRVCGACGGEGVGVRTDTIPVDLPPGVAEGELVVPGQGHAGRRGGPPGALRLAVTIAPHPIFRRAGHDLLVEVPVAIHEAALGARIEVPSLDGPVRLRIPPGTQSGQTFRLRDRGVPAGREGRRGDLVVTVRLVLPPVLDERSKELLREFGRLNPANVRESLGVGPAETPAAAAP
jgi:molecular chaperone DnaJ